eukprot:Gb_23614 [translate_table: standard]
MGAEGDKHCWKTVCNVKRWERRYSPMHCESWANIRRALSFSLAESELTHWNMNGRSSGHCPSSMRPAANSATVSQSFLTMVLVSSLCTQMSSCALMVACVCGDKRGQSEDSSLATCFLSRMADMARISTCPHDCKV